jgi:hypothetical protein
MAAANDAGALAELIAPQTGQAQAFNHLEKGDIFSVERAVGEATPDSTTPWLSLRGWPIPISSARSRPPFGSWRRCSKLENLPR